jgi:co-chaperonin GroES (HSP10)
LENQSGVQPVDVKVLVLPDPVEEKTSGGIYLADMVKEKEEWKTVKAVLVAVGGDAFYDWKGYPIPEIGNRVYIAVNSGMIIKGTDGKKYRMLNDKDIVGIIINE